MKKTILALLMAAAAATVFATGVQEVDENGVYQLERGPQPVENFLQDQESVKIEGVVQYKSPVPELVAGGKVYTLFAPGAMQFNGYLREGDKLSVEGFLLDDDAAAYCTNGFGGRGPGSSFGAPNAESRADAENLVWVETVTIDGKVYKIPEMDYGYGRNGGPAGGMKGGRMGGSWDDGRAPQNFGNDGRPPQNYNNDGRPGPAPNGMGYRSN